MVKVSSWGKLSQDEHDVHYLRDNFSQLSIPNAKKNFLPFGMGRSYGDQCLNPHGILLNTTKMDKFICFDRSTGILNCESGVLLKDIQQITIPQGWILPVSPGTELITLGGAIANDVHGKNHCATGTFGHHLISISLLRTTGEIIHCSPHKNIEWFAATVGGIGLTGIILSAEIQLQSVKGPWLETETLAFDAIDDYFQIEKQSETEWSYRVAWIDCIKSRGRGLFMRANHADSNQSLPIKKNYRINFTPPLSLINKWNLKLINEIYFQKGKSKKTADIQDYQQFFYPLDRIYEWNRLYGPKGFYQYQCAVPEDGSGNVIKEILKTISSTGDGSILAVLKRFGSKESLGMLSFPFPGYTFALDFPNRYSVTGKLFDRLDTIVQQAKGRIYLAKDARMSKNLFEIAYPMHQKFMNYRDPKISSAMSKRLMGI